MYINPEQAKKLRIPSLTIEVERGRLRLFAKAIGQTNPIYFDLNAAREAGHRDLPVPLTYLGHALELEYPNPLGWLASLGADLANGLHAEQSFEYYETAYAGDILTLKRQVTDVFTKRNGRLEFIAKTTTVMREEAKIADIISVIAIQHPEASP